MDLAPPRGTRDFYPLSMRQRNWLFGHFREVAHRFGFEEIDAPVIENTALYTRKAGEEIVEELYHFEDKGGRSIALRPEMTPSVARMVLARGGALPMPLRWFSLPQCWRYQRVSRGRGREHYQWNMDIFGVAEPTAEAELLAAVTTLLTRVGLSSKRVRIRVSNRKALQSVLERLGVTEERFAPVCVLVDKLEKVPRDVIEPQLAELGLDGGVVEALLEIVGAGDLDALASVLGDDHPAIVELRTLFDLARAYGYDDWLAFDASLVRGLAYYTGIVFEAFDRGGNLRAICGGGRYDRLLSTFGGKDLPACGFGFGDMVLLEFLSEQGLLPEPDPGIDDVVFAFEENLREAAVEVATRLRASGRRVDLVLEPRKVKWAYRHANRLGASRVVLVAPEEHARGVVRIKDLASGEESDLTLTDLAPDPDTP